MCYTRLLIQIDQYFQVTQRTHNLAFNWVAFTYIVLVITIFFLLKNAHKMN